MSVGFTLTKNEEKLKKFDELGLLAVQSNNEICTYGGEVLVAAIKRLNDQRFNQAVDLYASAIDAHQKAYLELQKQYDSDIKAAEKKFTEGTNALEKQAAELRRRGLELDDIFLPKKKENSNDQVS